MGKAGVRVGAVYRGEEEEEGREDKETGMQMHKVSADERDGELDPVGVAERADVLRREPV